MSSLKKVKIIAEYKGKNYYFEIESFKTCFNIEKQIRKIIYTPQDVLISYMNRIIELSKVISIREFFYGKSTISFKVIERDSSLMPQLPLINKKNHIANYSFILDNNTGYYSLNKSSDNTGYNYLLDDKDTKANSNHLCDCAINYVTLFCRNCRSFICKRCRAKTDHFSHDMVILDITNIEDCLNLYCNFLKSDITANMKAFTGYQKDLDRHNFFDISSKKELILKKIDEIEKKQKEMLKIVLQKNDTKKANEIQNASNKITLEIDDVFSKIQTEIKNNKVSYESATKYFLDINNLDNKVKEMNEFIFNFKLYFEINKKINFSYKFIEKALENIHLTNYNIFNEFSFLDEEIFDINLINKYRLQLENSINNFNNSISKQDSNFNQVKTNKDTFNNSVSQKNEEVNTKQMPKQKSEKENQINEQSINEKMIDKSNDNLSKDFKETKNDSKNKNQTNKTTNNKNI
jgi:hypothetical protein